MQRMVAAERAMAPKSLAAKPPATAGDWLSLVAFCLNGAGQLIETTPTATGCTGARVIGERAVEAEGLARPPRWISLPG